MRLPSIAALAQRFRLVLARFPWVMAFGTLATVAALGLINENREEFWARALMVSALGIPLATALTLTAERRGWTGIRGTLLQAGGVLLLALFYQVWPGPEADHLVIRYFQLSVALHLAVAFLPFVGWPDRQAFWQYNRRLFESILRSAVFSGVLFVGLVIALVAVDQLFGVDVPERSYARLFVVMAFLVNTGIFLAGVPERLADLAQDRDYPRLLKIFAQYILTPLVAIYLLLLTAYLVKILVTGDWPSGWVGYLVSSVAVCGILGFLLVAPLRDEPGEEWIRTYVRWMFIGLIPSAIMFLLALWKRIQPYGLTELRYLGLVLGTWLLGIAIYYAIRRDSTIRVIPTSLALILLVTLYGPLGATSLGIQSQAGRLREQLALARSPDGPSEARREVAGALRYLLERGAEEPIRSAFGGSIPGADSLPDPSRRNRDSLVVAILDSAGLELPAGTEPWSQGWFTFSAQPGQAAVEITGYRYHIGIEPNTRIAVGGDTLVVTLDSVANALTLSRRDTTVLLFDLSGMVRELQALPPDRRHQVTAEQLRISGAGAGMNGLLQLEWINGVVREEKPVLERIRGDLYLAPE